MKWILIILVTIVALVLAVVAIGYALPVKHVAMREARLGQPPEEVFLAITDVKNFPAWRPSVKQVEVLPANGHDTPRESIETLATSAGGSLHSNLLHRHLIQQTGPLQARLTLHTR